MEGADLESLETAPSAISAQSATKPASTATESTPVDPIKQAFGQRVFSGTNSDTGSASLDDFAIVLKKSKAVKCGKITEDFTKLSSFQRINGQEMRCLELEPIRIECTNTAKSACQIVLIDKPELLGMLDALVAV